MAHPVFVNQVRLYEKIYLWSGYLYYAGEGSPESDTDYDAVERSLELNRELWSDWFKSHLPEPDKPLKTQAHAINLAPIEKANAGKWKQYVEFMREQQERP